MTNQPAAVILLHQHATEKRSRLIANHPNLSVSDIIRQLFFRRDGICQPIKTGIIQFSDGIQIRGFRFAISGQPILRDRHVLFCTGHEEGRTLPNKAKGLKDCPFFLLFFLQGGRKNDFGDTVAQGRQTFRAYA